MFHLFIHQSGELKGKYDFAFIKNEKYICGSKQGYENRGDAIKQFYGVSIQDKGTDIGIFFQDDTANKSLVLFAQKSNGKTQFANTKKKAKKKHNPND